MNTRSRRIARTSVVTTLGVAAIALAAPVPALGGPVHSINASPTGLSTQSGNLVASLTDNSIRTTGPLSAGHRAGLRYCSPWASSSVKTLSTRTSRWHTDPHVGYIRVLGASGEAGRIPEAQQGLQGSVIDR